MKVKNFLLTGIFLLALACSDDNVTEVKSDPVEPGIQSVEGRIELTSVNSTPDFSDYDIISFFEDDDVESDNSFNIDVTENDEHPQMVFVENSNDYIVMAGIVRHGDTEVIINEVSTAKAMVLRNFIFLGSSAYEKEMILDFAGSAPSFGELLGAVTHAIQTDLDNVYNEEVFPELDELSSLVAVEVFQEMNSAGLFKRAETNGIGTDAPAINVNEVDKKSVTFSNHNLVYFSGQATNMADNSTEDVFTLGRRNSLLTWYWFGISEDVETNVSFKNYSTSYLVNITKGFEANLSIFNPLTPNGRASIMNIMVAVREAMKLIGGTAGNIVLGVDVVTTIYKANKAVLDPYIAEFKARQAERDFVGAMDELMKIGGIILTEGLATGALAITAVKLGLLDKIKGLVKDLASVIPVVKGILVAKQLGAETIPFVADLIGGDRTYRYYVRTYTQTDNEESVITAYEIEKGKPITPYINGEPKISSYRGKYPVFSGFKLTGFSVENKHYTYEIRLYKGGLLSIACRNIPGYEMDPIDFVSGNLASGASFSYETTFTDKTIYLIEVVLKDASGNTSPAYEYMVWKLY